jgi:DNA integrity scanning protein DisA with diadenylate cyclase activity
MASIAALTNALAFVISQSTGDARIFSGGKIFMAVEKSPRKGGT